MASIMPKGLAGRVNIASWYLPSRELGGDCFDYTWIDDDHLLVYLIDVSGHGIEPALLSVSVHNMLRSGSLGIESTTAPEAALAELNRLFQMGEQGDHYFTIWYGVYQSSTRTLRYVSAGAPPAFAFEWAADGTVSVADLSTVATPVGMFADTEFSSRSYVVPPGCRILIYSDGAHEITLADNRQFTLHDFRNLSTRLAGSSTWSLEALVSELQALTPTGAFEDDCSLIELTFD
jgi:sigma-B regulation protein RsbU (phosphoserine phosphatase)